MELKTCSSDTRALLLECSAGSKMAIESVDGMISSVDSDGLRRVLSDCRQDHMKTGEEADRLLRGFGDQEGEAPPIARAMSWMKINLKVNGEKADANAAAITYDGCSSGIRTLTKCMNENPQASEEAKGIARDIVKCEMQIMEDVRRFL